MTIEELLFGTISGANYATFEFGQHNTNSNTITRELKNISSTVANKIDVPGLIDKLRNFNNRFDKLREINRSALYRTFLIPKKNGKSKRRIDAPNDELMYALRELKKIFEEDFGALHHTSAFAYIKHRSTIDAVKRHQFNESKWFAKYDLSDFFGSTTLEFVMKMFGMIFPFSEVIKNNDGREELATALELAFLNGGLPQGTPISPTITNIMMIPIDHKLSNTLRNFEKQSFVYTRYADDFIISSRYDFNFRNVENLIVEILSEFNSPFALNKNKTRYGSSSGSNWNLGVMLNKDNEITVGNKKKRRFQAMLSSYVMDRTNGKPWELDEVQILEGLRSYYRMVEGETIDKIISHIGTKYNVDIPAMIKADLAR